MDKKFWLLLVGVLVGSVLNFQTAAGQTITPDMFQHLHQANIKKDSAVLRWNSLDIEGQLIVRHKLAGENDSNFVYSPPFSSKNIEYGVGGLYSKKWFEWQVGAFPTANTSDISTVVWSEMSEFQSLAPKHYEGVKFGLFEILTLIGALGFFIYGMKIMSEGIQKIAGNKLRQVLSAMTSNRITGVLTGFGTTALIQSSSATTVMVVSFVNAGLLSLKQAVGVIMGANIGTTVTAFLVAYLGFGKFSISAYALPIIAIGFPLLFTKGTRLKSIAEFLIGFALLFMGLELLKTSVPDLDTQTLSFLHSLNGYGFLSTIIFVLIGTIITIIVQSSSAAITLTLILCDQGYIDFQMAAGIVLGENIGTTITANLAALIGNTAAKRAARAHLIFNLAGVFWMLLVFPFFLDGIDAFVQEILQKESPFTAISSVKDGLSWFHFFFNIANTVIMIWFVKSIVKIVRRVVPDRGEEDTFHLSYIGTGMMGTPELSLLEAKKEVVKFGRITTKMSSFLQQLLISADKKKQQALLEKIKKYEEITDRVEEEVVSYLTKVSEGKLTDSSSVRIRSMMSITNDLERIGDIFFQMSKSIERKNSEKVWFTPEQRNNILEILSMVDDAFEVMVSNLESEFEDVSLSEAADREEKINLLRNKLRASHLQNVEKGEYNFKSGLIYNELFSSCEKVGDHIMNVSEAIIGKV